VATNAFSYAIVRVVPDLARGEFVNAGVLLHARQASFLRARVRLDHKRLAAIAPQFDPTIAECALSALERVAEGDERGGPMALLEQSERFGWLVAPSSTVVQCSPVHSGVSDDPARSLDELFAELV
jgi:hypothetical protein